MVRALNKGVLNTHNSQDDDEVAHTPKIMTKSQTAKSAAATAADNGAVEIDLNCKCGGCNKKMGNSSEMLQCGNCETWWHIKCANVNKDDYKFLFDNPDTSVNWFCNPCKVKIKNGSLNSEVSNCDSCDGKIDSITTIIKTMQSQMDMMQQQMATILEVVNKKDDKPAIIEKQIEAHMNQLFDEQKERDEKKNNVIIYNVEEEEESDAEKEMEGDIKKVRKILSVVLPDPNVVTLTASNVSRCGYRKENKTRPVKVKLNDNSLKGRIFVNSWKLKEKEEFRRIGISNDKTKAEQMKDRELRARLEEKKQQTGEDDWIIYRSNIIKRGDKPSRTSRPGGPPGGDQ